VHKVNGMCQPHKCFNHSRSTIRAYAVWTLRLLVIVFAGVGGVFNSARMTRSKFALGALTGSATSPIIRPENALYIFYASIVARDRQFGRHRLKLPRTRRLVRRYAAGAQSRNAAK
jgi:hypothetical protein